MPCLPNLRPLRHLQALRNVHQLLAGLARARLQFTRVIRVLTPTPSEHGLRQMSSGRLSPTSPPSRQAPGRERRPLLALGPFEPFERHGAPRERPTSWSARLAAAACCRSRARRASLRIVRCLGVSGGATSRHAANRSARCCRSRGSSRSLDCRRVAPGGCVAEPPSRGWACRIGCGAPTVPCRPVCRVVRRRPRPAPPSRPAGRTASSWRFWLIITNVDRKIASSETIMVRSPNG